MGKYVTNKKEMKFQNQEALKRVSEVIAEAAEAVKDSKRNIKNSPISELLAGAVGAGVGGAIGFAGLFFGGSVVGLSAPGIATGLATAGSLVGGGMVAGIGVIAAPAVILGAAGVGVASHVKNKRLRDTKEICYKEAVKKQNLIIEELARTAAEDKERIEYLNSLNILLQAAIKDLKYDLGE